MITLYGIPNCDSVKKARAWLTEHGLAHRFHDFKKDGIPATQLNEWLSSLGWELVINRKGTSWRGLNEASKASLQDAASAAALAQQNASLIKRPIVEWDPGHGGGISVGFDPSNWAQRL